MKTEEKDAYTLFYKEFGRVLKEGIHYDFERGEAIADLLLFSTTKTEEGKFRTLEEYVKEMKEDQQDIYYATATSMAEVLKSPYMEAFSKKDYELSFYWNDIVISLFSGFRIQRKKVLIYFQGWHRADKSDEAKKEKVKKELAS
jgi:molecular chaperone HtpG